MSDYKSDQDKFLDNQKHQDNLLVLAERMDVPPSKVIELLRCWRTLVKSKNQPKGSYLNYGFPSVTLMSIPKGAFKGGAEGAPDTIDVAFAPSEIAEFVKEAPAGLNDYALAEWAVQHFNLKAADLKSE